jgi:hypothetical protein
MKEEKMPQIQVFKEAMKEAEASIPSEMTRMCLFRHTTTSDLFLLAKKDNNWKYWRNPSEAFVRELMMAFNNPATFEVRANYNASHEITYVTILT